MSEHNPTYYAATKVSGSFARPHRAAKKLPPPDPAHASYKANALKAAFSYLTNHGPVVDPINVAIMVPAPYGTPLSHTAKVALDALVTAKVIADDKSKYVRRVSVYRIDPLCYAATEVTLSSVTGTPIGWLLIPGVPAPPNYVPVNNNPKFKGSPTTPGAYRDQLKSEAWVPMGGDSSVLIDPVGRTTLNVFTGEGVDFDLDNAGLRVIDYLEVLRRTEHGVRLEGGLFLIDEILDEIMVYADGNTSSDTVTFEFSVSQ